MGKVHLLSEELINKIAAGEVVDRPSSAVKELVENSIDAQATRIDIDIEQGGKRLIRIADDGVGMSREDAELALQRHATSKLRHENDLFQIMTMGFRGEALPSIASVSQFCLQTRPHDEPEGTQVVVEGGKPSQVSAVGRAPGTTIEVQDLFFNIPGRKKFLKADGTEFSHIAETITRLALANPQVRFRLTHNRRVQLQAHPTEDLRERTGAILGRQIGEQMYPVELSAGWLRISGLFSAPTTSSQGTKGIYLFVNGRFIKDRGLAHACQEAYRGTIEKGRYPYVVMFLELDPSEIDVNVHPQKIEVRFQRQHEVYSRLLTTLRSAVARAPWLDTTKRSASATPTSASPDEYDSSSHIPPPFDEAEPSDPTAPTAADISTPLPASLTPTAAASQQHPPAPMLSAASGPRVTAQAPRNFEEFRNRFLKAAEAQKVPDARPALETASLPPLPASQNDLPFLPGWDPPTSSGAQTPSYPAPTAQQQRPIPQGVPAPSASSASPFAPSLNQSLGIPATSTQVEAPQAQGFFSSLRYIGQFAQMYLVFEAPGYLILVDQHAAHERISYQRLLADFEKANIPQQPFLIPPRIELSLTAAQQAEQHQEDLERLGIHLEPFGGQSYVVKALPAIIKDADPHALLLDLLDELSSGKRTSSLDQKRDAILMRMACHSSVRGTHRLSEDEVRSLQRQLDSIDFRAHCPHGRPVYFEMPQKEIEKRFHRT